MKKKTMFTIILSALLILVFSSISVSAKTAIMPGVKIVEEKGSAEWNYGINLGLPGKAKIDTPSYNAVVLLPADLLVKKNSIAIEGRVDLIDPSIKDGNQYVGTVPSSPIVINVSGKGKISVERRRGYDGKKISMGGAKVSVKLSSDKKNYVVTIQNMPLDTTYFPGNVEWSEKNKKAIDKKKSFQYNMQFQVGPWNKINKAVNACMYVDTCSLKVAKTLTLNFTGNFQHFDAWSWHNDKETRPTRKITRVTY